MRICPKCNKKYKEPPAISRKDNKTEICSACGTREAIEDAEKIFAIKRNRKIKKER